MKHLSIKYIALSLLTVAPSAWGRTNVQLQDTVQIGLNATDYVLQKPLPAPVYPEGSKPARVWMSAGAGISAGNYDHFTPGYKLEGQLGYWVTPAMGLRLQTSTGTESTRSHIGYRAHFVGIGADFMVNFSQLLRGYNPDRKFELLGGPGIEYQRVRFHGNYSNVGGIRASMQARFNLNKSLYLYVEPRLLVEATRTRFTGIDNYRRMHPTLGLYAGLGYRILRGEERAMNSDPFSDKDDSHIFFGLGGGISSMLRYADGGDIGPMGTAWMGRWFTPEVGGRLTFDFNKTNVGAKHYAASGAADLVINLSSAFGGYRANEVFGMNLNAGFVLGYINGYHRKVFPGAEAGLTATFRLSPNWGIFIEPQAQFFGRDFNRRINGHNGFNLLGSVTAGLTYTIGDFFNNFPNSEQDYLADGKHWFLTFAGGPAWRFRGQDASGAAASLGFGKRFTPVSSWRITADGEIYHNYRNYAQLTVGADYMVSLSTAMAGYNPDRVFDVSGVLGGYLGAVSQDNPLNIVAGARVGLHGSFRLSNSLNLFIEPQTVAVRTRGCGVNGWIPEFRTMIGLEYRLGQPAGYTRTPYSPGDARNFISLSGAPNLNSGTGFGAKGTKANGSFRAELGHWFSRPSGLRLALDYDFIRPNNEDGVNIGSVHADYLLNFTSLFDPNPDRRFSVIGTLGAGLGWSNDVDAKTAFMAQAGVQFRYAFPCGLDLHIEPNASVFQHRVAPDLRAYSRIVATSRVNLGASYRF